MITPSAVGPAVTIRTEVEARADARLPLGFAIVLALPASPHWNCALPCVGRIGLVHVRRFAIVLALPARPLSALLRPGRFDFGYVFPGAMEPRERPTLALSAAASFAGLTAVPRRVAEGAGVGVGGEDLPIDLSRLPLPPATRAECQIQLCNTDGTFTLVNEEDQYATTVRFRISHIPRPVGTRILEWGSALGVTISLCGAQLSWDAGALPHAVVHISNRGRSYFPWCGDTTSLRVSPAASAFDLGTAVSTSDTNPLAARGIVTAVALKAGRAARFTTEVTISVAPLATPSASGGAAHVPAAEGAAPPVPPAAVHESSPSGDLADVDV